jgi:chlorophyllide a reductase subunit X
MGVSKNTTVAVYGKGGAGKSFITSMTAKTLTNRNNRVLQMGCDPKHDSVVTHFGGALIPTVLGTWAQYEKEGRGEDLAPENVIFKGDGVYCIERPRHHLRFPVVGKMGPLGVELRLHAPRLLGRRRLRRLRHADRALDGRQADHRVQR